MLASEPVRFLATALFWGDVVEWSGVAIFKGVMGTVNAVASVLL
jgi:hypothetical protein